ARSAKLRINDKNPAMRSFAERAAINAPIQGGAADIIKRAMVRIPAALEKAGLRARMLLLALAVTSTKGWIRRLGRRWQRLHRVVYVAGAAGVVHYYMMVKADTREPLIYGAVLAVLLGWRLVAALRRRAGRRVA